MESRHIQVDGKGRRIIIQGESYILLDLIYDMVTSRKGLLSFDNHLYNFLITLNFLKSLITNKQILKKLMELGSLTLKGEAKHFKSILGNTSTPTANTSCRNNGLMTPVAARQKL